MFLLLKHTVLETSHIYVSISMASATFDGENEEIEIFASNTAVSQWARKEILLLSVMSHWEQLWNTSERQISLFDANVYWKALSLALCCWSFFNNVCSSYENVASIIAGDVPGILLWPIRRILKMAGWLGNFLLFSFILLSLNIYDILYALIGDGSSGWATEIHIWYSLV